MYLRPDEVARVLEKSGFTLDTVTPNSYGYYRESHYIYINRDARMGRTALVIHPSLKQRSLHFAEPMAEIKTCEQYQQFPCILLGDDYHHYGIPHGFSSRLALERYLAGLFGRQDESESQPAQETR